MQEKKRDEQRICRQIFEGVKKKTGNKERGKMGRSQIDHVVIPQASIYWYYDICPIGGVKYVLKKSCNKKCIVSSIHNQVIIAQWLARRLATGEVLGSNSDKGENLLISELKGNLII